MLFSCYYLGNYCFLQSTEATMEAIYNNTLKSLKPHLHKRKPKNNDPVLFKDAILGSEINTLVSDYGWDRNGCN